LNNSDEIARDKGKINKKLPTEALVFQTKFKKVDFMILKYHN